jgi:hypothetical protein
MVRYSVRHKGTAIEKFMVGNHKAKPDGCTVTYIPHQIGDWFCANFFSRAGNHVANYGALLNEDGMDDFRERCDTCARMIEEGRTDEMIHFVSGLSRVSGGC